MTAFPLLLNARLDASLALPLSLLLAFSIQPFLRLVFHSRDTDVFDPAVLVGGYFLTYFCLRAIYIKAVPFIDRLGAAPYDDYIGTALWCACLGYICLSLGMASKLVHGSSRTRVLWPSKVPAGRILFLMLIGLGGLLYRFKIGLVVGGFGDRSFQRHPPNGLLLLLGNVPDVVLIAVCIFLGRSRAGMHKTVSVVLLVLCMGLVALNVAISGGKEALIKPLLESLIVFHYARRRMTVWQLAVIGVPTLLISFGVINFYRFVIVAQSGSPKSLSDVVERVASATNRLTASKQATNEPSAFEQMLDRDAGVDALALVVKYTPTPFPYAKGAGLARVLLSFIPRQIWHNKPIELATVDFESTYMGEPSNFNGFSSIHLISDTYRNFGLLGLAIGMFLFGVLLRSFYLLCAPSRINGTGVFIYAALLPDLIHYMESDLTYLLVSVLRMLVLLAVVGWFLRVRVVRLRSPLKDIASRVAPPLISVALSTTPVAVLNE